MKTCYYCGEPGDLRPYGPGGADICFPCMKATPEREATAKGNFGALLDANEVFTGVTVLTPDGPEPYTPTGDEQIAFIIPPKSSDDHEGADG